ncbi:MAG: isoprenylcysteine carboxylmethyltransferase family protein [Methyloligellaceae bacterium]
MFGAPQLIALLILLQRGLEEAHAAHNTKRLLAEGAREVGRAYYPVVAVTQLCWVAGLFLLISPDAPVYWELLVGYLALQAVRYWIIATLGRYWTHRIITLDGAPIVRHGPYGTLRHPFYVITLIETALLPLAMGAWGFAAIMTALWAAVLHYQILLEDQALAGRRAAEHDFGKPERTDASGGIGTEDQNRV